MARWKIVILLVLATVISAAPLWAAPRPALVPPTGTWQLDFELHGEPQLIMIKLPGREKPQRFWYLLYTVTNNTRQDVDFYPQFDLLTDTFKLYHAGVKSRQAVFDAIAGLYRKTMPLLEPEEMISGRILQGQDNARDSVAIFEQFDPNATTAKIFVAGLSNETITVGLPTEQDGRLAVLLRKTLELKYQVPGDRYNPQNKVMLYRQRQWIMR